MPVVLSHLDAAEPAHRIDDQEGRAVFDNLANRRKVGDGAGGALIVDDADGAVVLLGEAALDEVAIGAEGDASLDDTAELLITTARVLSEDIAAWQDLYGRKRLTLPA